ELGQVINLGFKNYGSLNYVNYVSRGQSCGQYADDFKKLILSNLNLQYWYIETWYRLNPLFHSSVVLKEKNSDLRIWLDFYTVPNISIFFLSSSKINESMFYTPVIYLRRD
ncbi:MAG: hypothetical protein N2445_03660, partial [Acidobacteria bacterium]|nr:hypothetical protein [Acidobacteriota bacterium]